MERPKAADIFETSTKRPPIKGLGETEYLRKVSSSILGSDSKEILERG